LLSSDEDEIGSSDNDELEITEVRSCGAPSTTLKRRFLEALGPVKRVRSDNTGGKSVVNVDAYGSENGEASRSMEKGGEKGKGREEVREWSVRDRYIFAEAMQCMIDFDRIARVLERDVDDGKCLIPFKMSKVARLMEQQYFQSSRTL
jgi:hypothetical protein